MEKLGERALAIPEKDRVLKKNSSEQRIAIIGAGLGGLSAAALLSSHGYDVVVFDQAKEIGGKAGTIIKDDLRLDTGPSLLTMKQEIEMVFKACGEKLEEHLTLRPHQTSFRYNYPDGITLEIFGSFEKTLGEIKSQLGSDAEQELYAFLKYSTSIWQNARPHFVLDDAPSLWNTFKKGFTGIKAVSRIDALNTMKNAIDSRISSKHLRHILYRYATYNGSDPAQAPATLNCIAHVELKLGGYGIEGGMNQLPKALYRIAKKNGASFRLGSFIQRINVHKNKVISLSHASGNDEPFDLIVSNADTRHLFSKLCPESSPHLSQKKQATRSTSALNILWHDPDSEPQRAPHTILFPDDYEAEFDALFNHNKIPTLPTVYLCDQTLNHGVKSPLGGHIVFGMINAPCAETKINEIESHMNFKKMTQIAQERNFLSPQSTVLWKRTPQELAERFPDSQGALYGPASHNWKSAFMRAGNHSSKIKGLFIASGTAHPGGGVPMAILSGWHAFKKVTKSHPDNTSKQMRVS